jgi:HSP20 family protein
MSSSVVNILVLGKTGPVYQTGDSIPAGVTEGFLSEPAYRSPMRRDDRDDPFGDIFDELERMMNEVTGAGTGATADTHADVYDEGDRLRLVADLPGVDKDDIDLKCDGETLTIAAAGQHRTYDERVRLPARVDEHSAEATFNNGVLEVAFTKVDDSAAIDLE